jgi:hypothetical protein
VGADDRPPWPFLAVLAALLGLAILPMPYGYYQFLRLVTCGLAAWSAVSEWRKQRVELAGIWGALAILYNPVWPLHLNRDVWAICNITSAVIVAGFAWRSLREQRC